MKTITELKMVTGGNNSCLATMCGVLATVIKAKCDGHDAQLEVQKEAFETADTALDNECRLEATAYHLLRKANSVELGGNLIAFSYALHETFCGGISFKPCTALVKQG